MSVVRAGSFLGLGVACVGARPIALQSPAVVVPFELRNDLALVRVSVNGEQALLVLDSGSGALVLDSAFAAASHVKVNENTRGIANGRTRVRIGVADAVAIGDARLTSMTTAIVDLTPVQQRVGYDVRGTIGYDLFKHFVVDVDYASRTITLTEPAAFMYHGTGQHLALDIVRNLPVVDAVLTLPNGPTHARLHIDLGSASYAVRLSRKFLDAHPFEPDAGTVDVPLGAGVGGVDQGTLTRLPKLGLGALGINRPTTALSREATGVFGTDAPTDGTIGVPVWRRSRLILDYSRREAIIEPASTFSMPDVDGASGLLLVHPDSNDNRWVVDRVIAGSAGDAAGIHRGDELTAINGRAIATLRAFEVFDLFRQDGSTISVSIGGLAPRTAKLTLRPIF